VRGNSAIEVKGHWSDAFLDREMTLMRAPKKEWGGDSKWRGVHNGRAGWLPERVSLRNLIRRFDAPVVSPDKNRSMFVFGEIAPEAGKTSIARRKASVKRLNAVVRTWTRGSPESEVFPALLKTGCTSSITAAIARQNPHEDRTEKPEGLCDAGGAPTLDVIKRYLVT